ncbi:spore protease YyaC [Cohnella panacarvi]|uniref:spore protease YyaC n=1 Tax=Cohnella panacarvi TaxID=400776 RepID=UPI0004794DE6|nr:spore protease YyaC [Cohnella panacarvi]
MSDPLAQAAKRVDIAGVADFIKQICRTHPIEQLTFVCIGTDRSTGDSLGPLVGTMLEESGFRRVIGTLREPCDADRLPQMADRFAREAEEGRTLVAIDACLGRPEGVGAYLVSSGPLVPAQSVGRTFPPIGAYSIAAIVNENGPKPYWTLQTTSLYRVIGMAKDIADALTTLRKNTNLA